MLSRRRSGPAVSVSGVRAPLLASAVMLLCLTACTDDPDGAPARASAVPSASLPGLASSAAVPRPTPDLTVRLTGDGLDLPTGVVAFGEPFTTVQPQLPRFLGRPSLDTGSTDPFSSYGTCPGSDLRVLEHAGGALQLFFGTLAGSSALTFSSWTLTGEGDAAAAPRASALVGDVTTFAFGPGTTLAALRQGLGDALTVADDELVGPSFRVQDQSGGFFGRLSGTGPDGVVESVQAGQGCGE